MKTRPHLWIVAVIGVIVPRRLRADWRQEWEAELRCREHQLAQWDRLDWRNRRDLLWRSVSAFWDALWLQRRRLESEVFQDLRYGTRLLVTNPGFSTVAVLTLALGIGANTAMFTLLDKTLLRPLPVDRPDELVIFVTEAGGTPEAFSYPAYRQLRTSPPLRGLAAYQQRPISIAIDGGQSSRGIGQIVSGNYFEVLGVRPAVGRFFVAEEDTTPGTHAVAVISHGFWRRAFAADPKSIGALITLNGSRYTVIGVTPAEFTGTTRGVVSDVYVPTMMHARVTDPQRGRSMLENPNAMWLRLIGRLEPGVSRQQAQSALSLDTSQSQQTNSLRAPTKSASKTVLSDGSRGDGERVSDLSLPLTLMASVVGLVLLAACANIANLLLARAAARRKEIAIRLAVGANRFRIVRQLLTESAILTTLGGLAGLMVAGWTTRLLLGFDQPTNYLPRSLDPSLDGRVLAFTAAVSLVTALLFSLAPSMTATTPELGSALKADSQGAGSRPGKRVLQSGLVVVQVALSVVLLIGAGLCVKSLSALEAIDPGFEPAKVLTASFDLSAAGYSEARSRQFTADIAERVRTIPGVESLAFSNIVPFSDAFWISGATPEGYQPAAGEMLAFDFSVVTPEYFHTLGATVTSGRPFSPQDTADAPRVAMINEATARKYWPDGNAVGKRLQRGPQSLEIVGIVRDGKGRGLTLDVRPAIYLPLEQTYMPELTLHVRSAVNHAAILEAMRRAAQSIDPSLPVYNLRTLAQQRDGSLYGQRATAAVLTLFAALAVLVSVVGIYGVLSYTVTERTRELGIRLAHGAQPRDLLKLIVRQGLSLILVGLTIGLAGAVGFTRLFQRLLFGVTASDPSTFTAVPIGLAAVALAACVIPAWRAARVDPMVSLRSD